MNTESQEEEKDWASPEYCAQKLVELAWHGGTPSQILLCTSHQSTVPTRQSTCSWNEAGLQLALTHHKVKGIAPGQPGRRPPPPFPARPERLTARRERVDSVASGPRAARSGGKRALQPVEQLRELDLDRVRFRGWTE